MAEEEERGEDVVEEEEEEMVESIAGGSESCCCCCCWFFFHENKEKRRFTFSSSRGCFSCGLMEAWPMESEDLTPVVADIWTAAAMTADMDSIVNGSSGSFRGGGGGGRECRARLSPY